MTTLNRAAGERLAGLVEAAPRQCWHNAFKALAALGDPAAEYVEGWLVIPPGIAIEHGWIELAGRIIDPTLWDRADLGAGDYFAGVRYGRATVQDVLRLSRQGLTLPIVWGSGKGARKYRHGFGGLQHAGYRAARDDAYDRAGYGDVLSQVRSTPAPSAVSVRT